MTDLAKLDKTISELESQAETLKSHNLILSKIKDISTSLENSSAELVTGNQNFDLTRKNIEDLLSKIEREIENIKIGNDKNTDKLIEYNRNFIRELDSVISSRLERFSSDIQVTIRQERTQLQESIQISLNSHLDSLKALYQLNQKEIKQLKLIVIVLSILSMALSIILFWK